MTKALPFRERCGVFDWRRDHFDDAVYPPDEPFRRIIAIEEFCPPNASYVSASLEWLAVYLTLAGQAEVHVGTQTLRHRPGSLIAIASGQQIIEQVSPDEPWHVLYLLLTGTWAEQMEAWLRRREPASVVWERAGVRPRQLLAESVEVAITQEEGWSWSFVSRCAELWGAIYADARRDATDTALVRDLARFLDEKQTARPSVAEMAAHLRMTPRQLLYRFRGATNEPLAQWVRRRRVMAARRLLNQGYSVTEVAAQLGFANPYHFSRTFKTVTGISPSLVRGAVPRVWHSFSPDAR